ncbi:tyrosine-type recombinase/integrase [Cellulomonas sp. NTE-D12]|uniref:tyrosine-type recombinase/integrase n=1 Tax=Cellulomonas sp. NTE-D12 TaxID=2962632 RepID=UPI003081397D|nr:hypothetical protein CELD12_26290 [Cellulomonas sp. NTE-D12]
MAEPKRLHEAVEEYVTYRRPRVAATTATNEAFVLRRFAAWYGNVQLRNMRPDRVGEWFFGTAGVLADHVTRDARHRRPITPATANYYRTRLNSFFVWATKRGYLRQDLLADVQPLPVTRRVRLQISAETLLGLPGLARDERDAAFIALITNSGFRASTATSIRVGDVDLVGGTIRVRVSKSHLEDLFPVSADLAPALAEWLRKYTLQLGRPLTPADYLFPARRPAVYRWVTLADGSKDRQRTQAGWRPDRPLHRPEVVVQDALRAAGVEVGAGEGVHTIRRSVARAFFDQAAEAGYDGALRVTSALLHHRSSQTTEVYLGLAADRMKRDTALRGQPFLSEIAARKRRERIHVIDKASGAS